MKIYKTASTNNSGLFDQIVEYFTSTIVSGLPSKHNGKWNKSIIQTNANHICLNIKGDNIFRKNDEFYLRFFIEAPKNLTKDTEIQYSCFLKGFRGDGFDNIPTRELNTWYSEEEAANYNLTEKDKRKENIDSFKATETSVGDMAEEIIEIIKKWANDSGNDDYGNDNDLPIDISPTKPSNQLSLT